MSVNRHLLVVVLSALLPLLVVAIVLSVILVREERKATEQALQASAQQLALALDAELARSFAALEALGRSDALRRGDLKTFYREAGELRASLGLWDNLLLLSPQADHLLNLMRPYGTALPPVPQPQGTLTAAQTRQPYVSNVLKGRIETDWLVYIAYPVLHGGEVKYVIGATMSYRYWTRWLAERVPEGAVAGIVDGNYALISRTRDPEKVAGQPVQPWYRERLAESASGLARGPGVSQADVVVAYQRSRRSPWYVNVLMDGAVLDAPMRKTATWVTLAVALALLIAIALATRRARIIEQGHRESEAALRESEARFRTIAHAAPAVVWTADRDGITFMNERWAELTGQSPAEALDRGWSAFVHPGDSERLAPQRARCWETGEPYEGEIRYRNRDGEYRWHAFRALPARDAQGRISHWYGCSVDIHEARLAQQALKEADRRKDEFLAVLAHELRNPLAPIRNALQLLKMSPALDPSLAGAREMMDRQVTHMVRLIDDLLDVSRITRGRLDLRREPVALARVVEQALETSRPHITQQLTVRLPSEPVHLDADPVRLSQVLSNLLNNAAKFTPRDGHIEVSASVEGAEAVIRVRDDGIGIAPEERPRLFQIFSQAGSPLERARGGLGIGLSLARSIVELHHGTIEAHSEGRGKGAEFVVRLPMLPRPEPVRAAPEGAVQAYAGAVRRVLVVDDVEDNAASLARLLALDGNVVETAAGGLQAVAKAQAFKPDLILLDLGLPDLSGYEACELIRRQPWGRGIVIVAMTGWGQEDDRRRVLAAGFDAHLVKPVRYEAIREILASPLMA